MSDLSPALSAPTALAHLASATATRLYDLHIPAFVVELSSLDPSRTVHAFSVEGRPEDIESLTQLVYGEFPSQGLTFEGPDGCLPTLIGWRGSTLQKDKVELRLRHVSWDRHTFWSDHGFLMDFCGGLLTAILDNGEEIFLVDGFRDPNDPAGRRGPYKGAALRN